MTFIDALEERLIGYLDKNLKEIKDAIGRQDAKIDRLTEERVPRAEFDVLRGRVDTLTQRQAVDQQRLDVLESSKKADDASQRQRPFQTWQIVVGAFGVFAVLLSCSFDIFMGLVDLVNIVLTVLTVWWHH